MLTVAWSGVPAVTSAGTACSEAQQHALSVVVDVVSLGGEGEGPGGIAAVEGDALRHARVVGRRRPSLVGGHDGDDYRPLRVGAQLHGDGAGGALRHGVGRSPEAHRHRSYIVIGDGDDTRGRRPGGYACGQARAEAQPDALAVVVQLVLCGLEGEGPGGVAAGRR